MEGPLCARHIPGVNNVLPDLLSRIGETGSLSNIIPYSICCSGCLELDDELSTTIAATWSSNTLSVRNSQWSKFISFCTSINQPPFPASTETVSRFLVWLARTCKYSTINNHVSAVLSSHKFHGYDPQFRDSFFIKMVIKGLTRRLGDKTVQMQPFSLINLKDMYGKLDHSTEDFL